jgi:hypothetical protein
LLPLAPIELFFSESHSRFLIAYEASKRTQLSHDFPQLPLFPIGKTCSQELLDLPNAKIPLPLLRERLHKSFSSLMDSTSSGGKK